MTDKRPISEHFILKFQNTEKDSKCSGKSLHTEIRMASDYPETILKTRRQWSNVFTILKENDFQLRILYLANYESNVRGGEKRIIFRHVMLSIYFTSHTAFLRSYQKIMPPKQKKIQEMGILHRRGEKYFQDSYVAGQ